MNVTIAVDAALVDVYLPAARADDSGVGVNYADQVLKCFKLTLPDGRKLSARRRGLKIAIAIGDATGEGLLRRIEHGPDVKAIFQAALAEAARNAGATLTAGPGSFYFEL
jgi:hypothetical protein